jgi:hypothetical protein
MATNIEGLNYASKLSVDDLSFSADITERELLDRLRLTMGSDSLGQPLAGVVDAIDPRNLTTDETSRPLIVYPSLNNPLQVNIALGTAVTPNGSIVRNTSLIEDFNLARTTVNDINVVFIENDIIDSPPIRITRLNTSQPTRRTQALDKIRVVLLADFINATTFPPDRLGNLIVLTVITVVETVTGTELQFDYTGSAFTFNRPWFSPVDIVHRTKIGSGTPTDTNAHGLTFGDLVSGTLTIFDQMLQTGGILARDDDIKGSPGTLCTETITPARILTDGGGSVTAGGRFGGLGANYIVLARFPVTIRAFYQSSHKGRAIAWEHIPGTRIVILPAPETFSSDAVIQYNEVFALEPPATIVSNNLAFTQPNTTKNELIISGGLQLTSLVDPNIDFDGSGRFPRDYTVYAKSDGTLLRAPQPIQTSVILEDIGTAVTPITSNFFGIAKILIGLADANPVSSMIVTLRLTGRDESNNPLAEDITFLGTTWVMPTIPGIETANQFITTTNIFASLTEIQVITRTDDGPNSIVQFWADIETETTSELNKVARAATILWDGLALTNLKDARDIHKNIPTPENRFLGAANIIGTGGTAPSLIAVEDFKCPNFRDSTKGSQVAIPATFDINIADYSLIQAGDSILFPTAKTLVAIVAGSPTRAIGQYLATTSNNATRDDMVLTINDVTFDSGFTAVGNATLTNQVNCSANTLGAQGNGAVTEPIQGDISAITLSGDAVGGIDQFGESVDTRFNDCIDTILPSGGTYDVSNIRGRYLSPSVPIGSKLSVRIILHGVKAPQTNIQLRVRVATGASEVWEPWEVIAGDGTVFDVSKVAVITKVQIEIFGYACGFSLYEL